MKRLTLAIACLLFSSTLQAQTALPTSKFALDQSAPDLATAQGYTFKIYVDGATTGTVVAMTCTGTASPFLCVAPMPAFTPGRHSVTFSASDAAGESPQSVALAFTMVVIPSTPANPRVQ